MKNARRIIKTGFSLMVLLAFVACSNNWKEGSGAVPSSQMLDNLEEISGFSTQSTSEGESLFRQALEADDSHFYYSIAPGSLGPVQSLMSFVDLSIFDAGIDPVVSPYDLDEAQVAFVDAVTDEGRRFVLVVSYKESGQENPNTIMMGDTGYSFGEDSFEASFESDNGLIVVKTFDLQDGVEDFEPFIQLKVYLVEGGQEQYLGKFSTLAGYGSNN